MEGGGVVGLSTSFYGRKFTSLLFFLFSITDTGSSTNRTFIFWNVLSRRARKAKLIFHELVLINTWTNLRLCSADSYRISHVANFWDISAKSRWNKVARSCVAGLIKGCVVGHILTILSSCRCQCCCQILLVRTLRHLWAQLVSSIQRVLFYLFFYPASRFFLS